VWEIEAVARDDHGIVDPMAGRLGFQYGFCSQEAAVPVQVGLFRAPGIVAQADDLAQPLQLGFETRASPGAVARERDEACLKGCVAPSF